MKTVIKTSIGGPFLRPYFILTAIALGFLALSSEDAERSFRRRMAAIPGRTQRRAKVPFCISAEALTTRPLVGPH